MVLVRRTQASRRQLCLRTYGALAKMLADLTYGILYPEDVLRLYTQSRRDTTLPLRLLHPTMQCVSRTWQPAFNPPTPY